MTRLATALLVALALLAPAFGFAANAPLPPENLTLTLARVNDSKDRHEYLYIINGIAAYHTLEGLKNYLKEVPKNSILTWSPGCCRLGDEPTLSSDKEIKKFQEFCAGIGIKLVIVPAG